MSDNSRNGIRFGVTLQGVEPPAAFQEQVSRIEEIGFQTLFVTDSSLHARYVYAYLTLAAVRTKQLLLGTGITHPFTRHPAVTANAIATLDELSGGRAILGLGTGDRPNVELGYSPAKIRVLREAVGIARRLFAGETLNHSEEFRLANARLHYPCRKSIPIFLACSGPKILELAGEIADGAIVQCGLFPEAVDFARRHIAVGAARAGRSPDEIDLWIMACGALSEDGRRALDQSRPMAAWFAQTAGHCCEIANIDPELVARIQAVYKGGEFHHAKEAASLVPDEMVELFTAGGTPERVRDRLARLVNHGVQAINFMPIGGERSSSLELFAEEVVRPLRNMRRP